MKKVKIILLTLLLIGCTSSRVNLEESDSGIYRIMCTLDDCVTVPFILDTGASETTIPYCVGMTLFKAGKIKQEDILESKVYILADGSEMITQRFMLHKLTIGNHEFREIAISVADNDMSPLLLGQNVLSQMNVVEINYEKDRLRMK